MTSRWDRRWYLPSTALAGLVFFLLRDQIASVPLRGLAALGIVAVGGMLTIAAVGAIRGLFDRPR